jgi:hemolysin-activating ACP:hemolysin acyltransferase
MRSAVEWILSDVIEKLKISKEHKRLSFQKIQQAIHPYLQFSIWEIFPNDHPISPCSWASQRSQNFYTKSQCFPMPFRIDRCTFIYHVNRRYERKAGIRKDAR